MLREDIHLRKIALKWVPHALTEVEKWTQYAICHSIFFFFNLHYSYIQEHLTLPTAMSFNDLSILQKKNSLHNLIPNPRISSFSKICAVFGKIEWQIAYCVHFSTSVSACGTHFNAILRRWMSSLKILWMVHFSMFVPACN